jgi:hypothetical protein
LGSAVGEGERENRCNVCSLKSGAAAQAAVKRLWKVPCMVAASRNPGACSTKKSGARIHRGPGTRLPQAGQRHSTSRSVSLRLSPSRPRDGATQLLYFVLSVSTACCGVWSTSVLVLAPSPLSGTKAPSYHLWKLPRDTLASAPHRRSNTSLSGNCRFRHAAVASMLHLLVLAAAFALAAAQGLAEWQKPLPEPPGAANCGRGRKAVHIGSSFTFHVGPIPTGIYKT